jgi:stearoyl-CoA desaturase (delta-9 desaturase)
VSIGTTAGLPGASAATVDTDKLARRLAYVTVCVPAVGFAAAIAFSDRFGFTAPDGALLGVMYLVTALGVEGGLHRFFSHRAFAAGTTVTVLWGIAGSMAAQGPVVFWVATHRIHHAFTDTDRDPHSPRKIGDGRFARLRGLWHGHAGWLFTVRRTSWSSHVPDLLASRTVMKVNQFYFGWVLLGLALPTALGGLLTATASGAIGGLLWGGLARIFLLDQVTWGVNSIGHTLGNRPYRTRDNSRNIALLAPFSVGGSWHNNHHSRPSLATNRHRFWQLDITGAFIRVLDLLGFVSNVRYRDRASRSN